MEIVYAVLVTLDFYGLRKRGATKNLLFTKLMKPPRVSLAEVVRSKSRILINSKIAEQFLYLNSAFCVLHSAFKKSFA